MGIDFWTKFGYKPSNVSVGPLPPTPIKPIPVASTLPGIDVSYAQGIIDWAKIKASGQAFALIKATEGLTVFDAQFKSNVEGCRANGILCAPYHFFHPKDDPIKAANIFLGAIKPYGFKATMIDVEVMDGASIAEVVSNLQIWLNTVEASTGMAPIFYSDPGMYGPLKLPASFARYPLMHAQTEISKPTIEAPWAQATFWQYSWKGSVPGITTTVDMDTFYGSEADLAILLSGVQTKVL